MIKLKRLLHKLPLIDSKGINWYKGGINSEMNHKEIFHEFLKWSPYHANMVVDFKPWGENSIAVWFNNGDVYKAKMCDEIHFVLQKLSQEDIDNKFK